MQTNEQPIPAHELHGVLSVAHYDLYKDVHGVSPSWIHYECWPTPELEADMLFLMEEGELEAARWELIDAHNAALEAVELEEARVEAVRAHTERWMDTAAALGACGW